MHILIVTAHPDPGSFTHAAVARFVRGTEAVAGASHEIVDLLAEGFDPRFSAADDDAFDGRTTVGPGIVAEQRRIDRADALVLIFPVYWWFMPAVMKGWIDRVFVSGWAFIEEPDGGTTRLLGGLKGRVIAIGGTNRGTYERRGYLTSLETQIAEGVLRYCGMPVLGLDLLLPLDEASAEESLQQTFELGRQTALGTG